VRLRLFISLPMVRFDLNSMGQPVLIAIDFIIREDWPLILEDSDNSALQQPAIGGFERERNNPCRRLAGVSR